VLQPGRPRARRAGRQHLLSAREEKLCIVCAAEFGMNARVFEQCRIADTSNLVIREMCGHREFERMLKSVDPTGPWKLCDEVVAVCTQAMRHERAVLRWLATQRANYGLAASELGVLAWLCFPLHSRPSFSAAC